MADTKEVEDPTLIRMAINLLNNEIVREQEHGGVHEHVYVPRRALEAVLTWADWAEAKLGVTTEGRLLKRLGDSSGRIG